MPSTDREAAAERIERIDFARKLLVTVNSRNQVLTVAARHLKEMRLGRQLEHLDGDAAPSAADVTDIVTDRATE